MNESAGGSFYGEGTISTPSNANPLGSGRNDEVPF